MIHEWNILYALKKQPFIWPGLEDWVSPHASNVIAARFKLSVTLAELDGRSIEGMLLILEFDALAPHDGAAILMLHGWNLGRFDFGEAEGHSNSRAIAGGISGLPPSVHGSHVHPFAINAVLGCDAFAAQRGRPPAAIAIEDRPPSFRNRMRAIGEEFSIVGLDALPPHPYQGDLWR